jgi:hypothetical protein
MDRFVFTIDPWMPYSGDSGQINGLSGSGGYHEGPLTDEAGNWLIFDTSEEAEAEAIKLGYHRIDVTQRLVVKVTPNAPPSTAAQPNQ